ncbi:MAG: cache domain-containing protein, partial [Thermodesulfobacteriota bacterium]
LLTKPGLSRKIITLLLVSSVIPLCVLTFIYFAFYFQSQKYRVMDIEQEIGKVVSINISAYLKKILGQIQFTAATAALDMKKIKELNTLSDLLLDQMSELDEITFIDLKGNEVSKFSKFYSFRPFELKNVASDLPFQLSRNGEINIGPVEIRPFSRFPVIPMTVPVLDLQDKVVGVMAAGVNIQKMWEFISKHHIGENRYAYVVDSKGILIAFEDPSSVLQKMDLSMIPGVSRFINGNTGVFEYKGLNGEKVIGAVASIPLTGWGVLVEETASAAFKDLRLLTKIFFGIFLVTIFLAIFFGLRFSHRFILSPVTLLKKEVEAISTGDFDRKILMESSDELGRLAYHLNLMTDTLNSTTVSRNRLIEEIAERKKVEATLQKSEATLKGIFRAAPIGIGLIVDRTMHWINDTMCDMTGYTYGELAYQSARILYLTEEEFERVGKIKREQLDKKGTGSVETRWIRKDGRIIDVLLSWARIHADNGSAGETFTVLDITEKKQAEEEKQKLESRLQQAQKMEAIGTLAGGIAHDFNNILGIILGNAELGMEDIPKWHPGRRNLEEIRTASLRAKDVVRHLLSFARKSEYRHQVIHIIPVIEETLSLLR